MQTIGVIGGIGPQATMDFEARVHRVAQQLIPQDAGYGYPGMIVYYLRHAPLVLNEDGTPRLPPQPDPRLLEAAARLGALADFLVITSNGAHLFVPQVEQAAGKPVLSMIDQTIKELQSRGWKKVGVLGMGKPVVYLRPLEKLGIACETIDADLRAQLDAALFGVMEGRDDASMKAVAHQAIESLQSKRVDGIILGCTELPFLLPALAESEGFIHPIALLANSAVRRAIQ